MTNKVSIIMGSKSDLPIMQHAMDKLNSFGIKFEAKCISAHRAPRLLSEYVSELDKRGFGVVIAGAGCAAHLPGVTAAFTHLPVLGVPLDASSLKGLDSLMSIVQMPAGIPVGTLAIGKAGAINAAIMAASIIALSDVQIKEKLLEFRCKQQEKIANEQDIELAILN